MWKLTFLTLGSMNYFEFESQIQGSFWPTPRANRKIYDQWRNFDARRFQPFNTKQFSTELEDSHVFGIPPPQHLPPTYLCKRRSILNCKNSIVVWSSSENRFRSRTRRTIEPYWWGFWTCHADGSSISVRFTGQQSFFDFLTLLLI